MRGFLLFLLTGFASAQDFYWGAASARSLAQGGAYSPRSGSVLDAMAVNPAGLAWLNARTLDFALTGVFPRGSFSNSVNVDAPLATSPKAVPVAAFGTPLGKTRFRFGASVLPELASDADWTYRDAPGTAGATYGVQRHRAAIVVYRTAAGLGFAISEKLSAGATFGVVYNSNRLQAPYIFQSHPALRGLKTLLDLRTNGTGWNASFGAVFQPNRKLSFGGAWKSRTVIESTGEAAGTLNAQFAAIGLNAPPDYTYRAAVRNVLPQSVNAHVSWQAGVRWLISLQGDWVNWKRAFRALPVALSEGSNPAVNGLLGTDTLNDSVPLDWKDRYGLRAGFERSLTEQVSIRGGFARANQPVPRATALPITAAIWSNQFTTGGGYRIGAWTLDLAYVYHLTGKVDTRQSAIAAGEYHNSRIRAGTQSLTLSGSVRF